MATLKLMRPPEKSYEHAAMNIFLNGTLLGLIGNGENKAFPIPAGSNKLKIKTGSFGSETYTFSTAPDETKVLVISNNKAANTFGPAGYGALIPDLIINGFLLLYYFTIGHNRYLTIQEPDKNWL